MANKFKAGKFLVVIFLSILIWVWADRAKTETLPVTIAVLKVNESAEPQLWITFNNRKSVNIDKIVLEGSSSKIDDVQRKMRERTLAFEFFLGPEQLPGLKETVEYSVNLLDLIRKSQEIRQLGLSVQSCVPETVSVQVYKLVENTLNVECVDESSSLLEHESIAPSKVTIPVPGGWTRPAQIKLTPSEIKQARVELITNKIPFVELADGQLRYSNTPVKVKLPPTREKLPVQSIQQATVGILASPNLFGKYEVKLTNEAELATISIKATSAAAQRYKDEPYQMLLYILEEDAKKKGEQSKPVVYNFPEELVRNNEIELNQLPVRAKFELVPIKPNE